MKSLHLSSCVLASAMCLNAATANGAGPGYPGPSSNPEVSVVQTFKPIVNVKDYIKACGDYPRINQSETLQRLSRNWQRCYAYTSATIATMRDMEGATPFKQFCVPHNVSTEYAIDLTVKYANKLPETKSENPAKIMLEALAVRYPCQVDSRMVRSERKP